jgi:hypothetical protein
MFVILDTTEFYDVPQVDSNSFRVLQEYLRRTNSQLKIPDVVLREVVNHAREQLLKIDDQIKNAERDYERLRSFGANIIRLERPDVDLAVRAYEAQLRDKLRLFNTKFLPMPTETHEQVLERALKRKKPFAKNKDGYRDTLIWLTVLAEIKANPGEYVFVTNNSKDFAADELVVELGNLPEGCSLRFERDLNSFIENHAKAALEQLAALKAEVQGTLTLPGVDLQQELGNLGENVLREVGHQLRIRNYQYDNIESPYYIDTYDPPDDIEILEVYRAQDEVMIECRALYECTIEGFLFKSEAYGRTEEDIYVTDWEWNEHYVAVEFHGTIQIQFLLRLAEENLEDNEAAQKQYSMQSVEVVGAVMDD